jgi:hypothetical protein
MDVETRIRNEAALQGWRVAGRLDGPPRALLLVRDRQLIVATLDEPGERAAWLDALAAVPGVRALAWSTAGQHAIGVALRA